MALFTRFQYVMALQKQIPLNTLGNMLMARTLVNTKIVSLTNLYQERFYEKLKSNNIISDDEWKNIRNDLMNSDPWVTKKNVDSIIIDTCASNCKVKAALSYIEFLKNNKYDMNLNTTGKYLKLFRYKGTLSDSDKKDIFETIDNILKKYPIMDASITQNCIGAICLTERWQEAIKLVKVDSGEELPPVSYMFIIVAAFKHGNPAVGFEYLSKGFEIHEGKIFQNQVFLAYLDYCTRYTEKNVFEEKMAKMFDYCKDYYVTFDEKVLDSYAEVYNRLGWTSQYTPLNPDGICWSCQHRMLRSNVITENFEELSKAILETLIIGGDVYRNSNPKELNGLISFVKKTKPYDIVIDGLNVSYCSPVRSHRELAKRLAIVVKYFVKRNKTILVLGRKHMHYWPKESMQYVKDNAYLFLAEDLSQDDPYLLYATMTSGERTCFVSGDLMRQHKYRLSKDLRTIFKRWQITHQYKLVTIKHDVAIVAEPPPYLPIAQEDENGWHLPCIHTVGSDCTETYNVPTRWLCLRKGKVSSR